MEIHLLKNFFFKELESHYPKNEIRAFFYTTAQHLLDMSSVDLALKPHESISKEQQNAFQEIILKLKKNVPIQYILGETEFFGLKLEVNQHTLIPRPETEELVYWILHSVGNKTHLKILDIGTGSGCIAISVAKNLPTAMVHAIDISEKALIIARKNAIQNKVTVNLFQQDILATESLGNTYDVIISNPPYVRNSEKKEMKPNVLDHEPASALFVENDDPLLFYRKIAKLASESLNTDGLLFFEINQYLPSEVEELLKSTGFKTTEIKKDFLGNYRMAKACLADG